MGGNSWVPQNSGVSGKISDISCASQNFCAAIVRVDDAILTTNDGGNNWLPTPEMNGDAISCPTTTHCVAIHEGVWQNNNSTWVDGGFWISDDGGASWQIIPLPDGPWFWAENDIYSLDIDCATENHCLASLYYTYWDGLGPEYVEMLISYDGGYNWEILPTNPLGYIDNIECPTTNDCYVRDFGVIASTHDGGESWSWEHYDDLVIVGDISCATANDCVVVTQNTVRTLAKAATIVNVEVPVRENGKARLIDGDLTTSWNTDGNADNAWFELDLGVANELTHLKLAPRTYRAYKFNVFVDNVFVKQYATTSSSTVTLQSFALPAGTTGSKVRVEAINQNWFKVYEVELIGHQTEAPPTLSIIDTNVSVRIPNKDNLHDNDLATSWNNDGNIANAWFDVILNGSNEITELRLAPRTLRAYTFNVYVDSVFVGQYTTASASSVALQNFALPAGTNGSVVRIESVSHNWFKVHEVELYNGASEVDSCGKELRIDDINVPARQFRKKYLIDDNLASTSFWSNSGETWFELSLDKERNIDCLQLAPRENRAYTFNVYVDGAYVAQYTTSKTDNISLQNFTLPAGTAGSMVRIESVSHNWLKVHEVKLHGGFVNVALNANVQLNIFAWSDVSADTIVDGIFLPKADTAEEWVLWYTAFNPPHYIDINLNDIHTIHSLTVQADSNDAYELLYWDLTTNQWQLAWKIPNYAHLGLGGILTRPNPDNDRERYVLPSPITTNAFRFTGVWYDSDFVHGVSEIQAFALQE